TLSSSFLLSSRAHLNLHSFPTRRSSDLDATLIIVKMKNRVYLIGRGHSTRINLLPILTRWEGGGHEQAGSASVKNGDHEEIYKDVEQNLELIIKPAITARDIMSSPV